MSTKFARGGETTVFDTMALFTYATSRIPDDTLAAPLRAAGIQVEVIGDGYAPGTVVLATAEDYRRGLNA
ncbi:hypothetical protein [Phenylobacterium sp.]|uniref:hypothetical protein n=1 Tax=Phenylobacterium sp. TaxID=1871053 RepID=UPI00398388E2